LPEAGSSPGELSAVKQRVKRASTALALRVSSSCHRFPHAYGKCKQLKGNAGFDGKLEVNKSILKKPQPVKILPRG